MQPVFTSFLDAIISVPVRAIVALLGGRYFGWVFDPMEGIVGATVTARWLGP